MDKTQTDSEITIHTPSEAESTLAQEIAPQIPQTPMRNTPRNTLQVTPAFQPSHPNPFTVVVGGPITPEPHIIHPYSPINPQNPFHWQWPIPVDLRPEAAPRPQEAKRETRPWRTASDKVNEVLNLLKSFKWSIGDFLYHTFAMEDSNHKSFNPTSTHYHMASKFLTGETNIPVAKVLELWMTSAYGLPPETHSEREIAYSTEIDYLSIRYARPAMTSFAAQLVKQKLVREATKTVRSDGGLHTFTSCKNETISRYDLGDNSFQEASDIFRQDMPLAWQLLVVLAAPNKDAMARERRPPEMVITQVLSTIAYSRNMYAKLLPLLKGIYNFACGANHYLYKYDSRVGVGASYNTVYGALIKLAANDAKVIQEVAKCPTSSWVLRFDNVQHYVRPRNFRVGREATMKIGTAGTVFEFLDFSVAAMDIRNKRERLAEGKRKGLTFQKLIGFMDMELIDKACASQWLRVLVNYIPCLKKYRPEVTKLYTTVVAKKILPPRRSQIFPLPTNGHNETITAELLKALLDFVKEMGYTEDSPPDFLIHAGGDGLTYERMVLLKLYMQFHDTPFQRLEWLQPFLETWHTSWTDLSRIFEAHWDSLLSSDPSSIGHSANQIKRKAPSNLKKVDYYPYSELAYQVLDARILDCWRIHLAGKDGDLLEYFESAEARKEIPSFANLWEKAQILFKCYGHPHAFERALDGTYYNAETTVPTGDSWVSPIRETSSVRLGPDTKKKAKKSKKKDIEESDEETVPFQGDQSLAQSCRFMYDATVSREVIYAIADGDIGRVWEALKSMILTFAGSTHGKYMKYLLEMLCDLELESSPELRDAFLANWIINPSGERGRFVAGDKFQEQLQDEMYEHIGRKDKGFDENYMRKVIAPNAYRFVLIKKSVTKALGLEQHGGKHAEPHTNPEMQILLQVYKAHQLHLFRSGRTYGGDLRKVDDLGRGVQQLIGGKLTAWVDETTRARLINPINLNHTEDSSVDISQLDEEAAMNNQESSETRTAGCVTQTDDGELIFEFNDDGPGGADEPEGLEEINE